MRLDSVAQKLPSYQFTYILLEHSRFSFLSCHWSSPWVSPRPDSGLDLKPAQIFWQIKEKPRSASCTDGVRQNHFTWPDPWSCPLFKLFLPNHHRNHFYWQLLLQLHFLFKIQSWRIPPHKKGNYVFLVQRCPWTLLLHLITIYWLKTLVWWWLYITSTSNCSRKG